MLGLIHKATSSLFEDNDFQSEKGYLDAGL